MPLYGVYECDAVVVMLYLCIGACYSNFMVHGIHTNMYFWVEVLEGLDLQSLAEGRQSGTVHCHLLKVV